MVNRGGIHKPARHIFLAGHLSSAHFSRQDKSWDGMAWSDGDWMLRGRGVRDYHGWRRHPPQGFLHVFCFPSHLVSHVHIIFENVCRSSLSFTIVLICRTHVAGSGNCGADSSWPNISTPCLDRKFPMRNVWLISLGGSSVLSWDTLLGF